MTVDLQPDPPPADLRQHQHLASPIPTPTSTPAPPSSPLTRPGTPAQLTPFATRFLALPPELLTRILLFLAPDDLGVLSRVVACLRGLERDRYLWSVWVSKTAPSRIGHALFSPLSLRPDPLELVRRGTLRGVGIVAGVRAGGYWASEPAVRLSHIHAQLTRHGLERNLTLRLAVRPSAPTLVAAGILPSSVRPSTHPVIAARAHALDRMRRRDDIRRALRAGGVGKQCFAEYVSDAAADRRAWAETTRVVLAICPSIKEKRRFFESLGEAAGTV